MSFGSLSPKKQNKTKLLWTINTCSDQWHSKYLHPIYFTLNYFIRHILNGPTLTLDTFAHVIHCHSLPQRDAKQHIHTFAGINKGAASSLDIRLYSLRSLHHRYNWCIANDAVSTNATPNKRSSVDTFMFNMARTSIPNAFSSFISNSGLNSDNIG